MKLTPISRLSIEDFRDSFNTFENYLDSENNFRGDVLSCLRGNFTLEDNARVQVIEYKFTHNVKSLVLNKLNTRPRALIPVYADAYNIITGSTFGFEHDNQIGIILLFNGAPATPIFSRLYLLG